MMNKFLKEIKKVKSKAKVSNRHIKHLLVLTKKDTLVNTIKKKKGPTILIDDLNKDLNTNRQRVSDRHIVFASNNLELAPLNT